MLDPDGYASGVESLLRAGAESCLSHSEYRRALEYLEEWHSSFGERASRQHVVQMLLLRARACHCLGRFEERDRFVMQAEGSKIEGDLVIEIKILEYYFEVGDYNIALNVASQLVKCHAPDLDNQGEIDAWRTLHETIGNICFNMQKFSDALAHYHTALELTGLLDDAGMQAATLYNIACVMLQRGDCRDAYILTRMTERVAFHNKRDEHIAFVNRVRDQIEDSFVIKVDQRCDLWFRDESKFASQIDSLISIVVGGGPIESLFYE